MCNIRKTFGLKTKEFVCKMIIGCNPEMMDLIMHGLQHCVIRVSTDSVVMGVSKDSGHDT